MYVLPLADLEAAVAPAAGAVGAEAPEVAPDPNLGEKSHSIWLCRGSCDVGISRKTR